MPTSLATRKIRQLGESVLRCSRVRQRKKTIRNRKQSLEWTSNAVLGAQVIADWSDLPARLFVVLHNAPRVSCGVRAKPIVATSSKLIVIGRLPGTGKT